MNQVTSQQIQTDNGKVQQLNEDMIEVRSRLQNKSGPSDDEKNSNTSFSQKRWSIYN